MDATLDRLTAALADRYRIERELGAGGMATVYLAQDVKHGRRVALKVLRPELSALLGAERFLKEIELTAGLQHPHLLPLFDSGEAAGLLYYVMPYVAGESLRQRLARERQLGVEDAIRITVQVASALDHAHRIGVVHRDIKPENILLNDGQALIADFGIALALRQAGGKRLTETGLSLGTPQYMSPEQAAGDRGLDARSDVYSLACVLYEMLAGEPPHNGPTVQAVIAKLLTDVPRPVTELRDTVPDHVRTALQIALAKLPADRFASAGAFGSALTDPNAAAGLLPSRMNGGVVPTRRWLTDRRTIALAGVAVLAAAVLTLRPSPRTRSLPQYTPIALAHPPRLRNPWGSTIALSRDGQRLAYFAVGGHHVLDMRTGTTQRVSSEQTGLDIAFSPSGDSVVLRTTSWLGQLFIIALATGQATLLTDSALEGMAWGDDGWVYYRDLGTSLRRIRISDRARELLVARDSGAAWRLARPRPVPGGRGIVYTRRPAGEDHSAAEIFVADLRTGEQRSLTRGIQAEPTRSGHLLVVKADGSVFASQFDQRALRLEGTAVKVLDSVSVTTGFNTTASLSVGNDGTLAYVRAEPIVEDTLVLADAGGRQVGGSVTWGGWVNNATSLGDTRVASVHRGGHSTPNLWVRTAREPDARRLTFGDVLDISPQILGTSRDVAFVSPRGGRNWDLYSVPLDGSDDPRIILDRPGDVQFPQFSRDGRWVVFCERDRVGRTDVVARALGGDTTTLTVAATDALECGPALSPDGRWIAYHSNESGRNEVYAKPFPTGGARWQVSAGGGAVAYWGDGGRTLYYLDAARRIVAVPVQGSTALTLGTSRVLFTLEAGTAWFGMHSEAPPTFILSRRRLEAPGQVILIRNFTEILRSAGGR